MIAQYLLHLYNGNIESNGIQPRYFGVVYTAPQIQRAAFYGIQPCYFWVVYTIHHAGGNTLPGIQPCHFRVLYTLHRYSVPQGCRSPPLTQQTSQQSIPASTTTMHLHRR